MSQVIRTAEIKIPLILFIMSPIVCISATLYGAVETLEVNESMRHQPIKPVEERSDHQYCYSIEHRVAL